MNENKNIAAVPKVATAASSRFGLLGFRTILNAIVVAMFSATVFTCIYVTYKYLRTSKIRDSLAILYLELEKKAEVLTASTHRWGQQTFSRNNPKVVEGYVDSATRRIVTEKPLPFQTKTMEEMGFESAAKLKKLNFIRANGSTWVIYRKPRTGEKGAAVKTSIPVAMHKVKNSEFFSMLGTQGTAATVYITNRTGELIYSNSKSVGAGTVNKRELVQKFISLSVTKGQISFTSDKGEKHYGFFNEIAGTNLIVFAELPEGVILAEINQSTASIFTRLGIAASIFIFFLQIALHTLLRPFGSLIRQTHLIATGDFSQKMKVTGAGEFRILADNMNYMADSLMRRDEMIKSLMKDQSIKITLDNELNIARNIQEKFLPANTTETLFDLKIGSFYKPSGHVAGDWYNIHHCDVHGLVVVAIVDISGHGAGASMFTAIAASIYESYIFQKSYVDTPVDFFHDLNRKLIKYGKGGWHATAQLMIYNKETAAATIYNAGHIPPILVQGTKIVSSKLAGGSPLGFDGELSFPTLELTIGYQDTLLMCTDGLIEARNTSGSIFGRKRAATTLAKTVADPQKACMQLVSEATSFQGSDDFGDDVCLVAIRRRA